MIPDFDLSKAVRQTKFVGPNSKTGNCTEAAIATLLQIPLSAVPEFNRSGDDASDFWESVESFLVEHGLYIKYTTKHKQGVYLVSGPTVRGRGHHTVIYKDGQLAWDPHPSDAGVTEDVWCLHLQDTDPYA